MKYYRRAIMKWMRKLVNFVTNSEDVVVRTRDEKGRYVGDDKSTPDVNEAYTTKRVKKSKK